MNNQQYIKILFEGVGSVKVRVMKDRNWYAGKVGKEYTVKKCNTEILQYQIIEGELTGWYIQGVDAEVVEDVEKSCETCGLYVNQLCQTIRPCLFNGYIEWQPIMRETADPSNIVKGSEQRKTGTTEDAKHYMTGKQQPIEIMQEKMTNDQFIGFLLGNVIKYSLRINHKDNDREDAGKCNQYSQWLCDVMDGKTIVPGGK